MLRVRDFWSCPAVCHRNHVAKPQTDMTDEKDTKISALFDSPVEADDAGSDKRLDSMLKRVRTSVGQRDSLLFAIVKIWAAIAEMLAPVFAQLGERQAATAARARLSKPATDDDDPSVDKH